MSVGFLIYMACKLCWRALVGMLWVCCAALVFPAALVASVCGHDRTARRWMRSLNWRHVF
jgi:hypothetical protein